MSGELTPSQFRYTTTNNRDIVIGDPTDSAGLLQSKYIVFQTNTTPGHSTNPYIGVVYSGGSWTLQFSSNGSTVSSFALLNSSNTFTSASTNLFQGATNFTGLVTFTNASANIFNSPVTFNDPVTYNSTITYSGAVSFSYGITVTSASTFNSSVSIVGGLTVGSSVTFKGNTLVLNNSSTTVASVGSGILVEGTGSTTLASIKLATTTTTSDTWAISTNGNYPVNIMCDSAHPITFASSGVTAARTYTYPDASGTLVVKESTFTGNKILVATADLAGVAESSVSLAALTALSTGNYLYGITAPSGTFSGTVSANSIACSGVVSATGGVVSGAISSTGTITGTQFFGDGSNLTGTATGLVVGSTSQIYVNTISTGTTPWYPLFSTSLGSQQAVYGNGSLLYIPGTGALIATSFVGAGTGLTGTAASLSIGGNAATATLATSTTNVASGTSGALLYQSAVGTTSFISAGAAGQVLAWGSSTPTWSAPIFAPTAWFTGYNSATGTFEFTGTGAVVNSSSNFNTYFTESSGVFTANVACTVLISYQVSATGSASGGTSWTTEASLSYNSSTSWPGTTSTTTQYAGSGTSYASINAHIVTIVQVTVSPATTLSFLQTNTNCTGTNGQSLSIMVI